MLDHLDGISFRKLAVRYNISKDKAQRICLSELKKLPDNNQLTFKYCGRFGGVLMPDAKYINVKGYEDKLAFLWAVDYFKHDFPVINLAPSENYQSWARFFSYFRIINRHYDIVVCDDNVSIKMAAVKAFPNVRIQTCYNHLKESYRRTLKVRSDVKYRHFMRIVESALTTEKRIPVSEVFRRLSHAFDLYKDDEIALSILLDLKRRQKELFAFKWIKHTPKTTNLIESYNSHLESRLNSIRSFQSEEHARLWLNGYVVKRRFTKYTDCRMRFKKFNGMKPIEITLRRETKLPKIFKNI